MGDDGVFRRDRLHEVPHDPIGVDRRLVVGELGPPFGQPSVPLRLDFPGHRLVPAAAGPHHLPAGFDHLTQHKLGVSHYGMVDVVVLVDVPRVVGCLDHRLARGNVHGHSVFGEAAPYAEHQVGPAHEVEQGARHDPRSAAQGQVVGFREGALAQQGGHDWYLKQLGQLNQLIGGLGVEHALAGVNHRVLGLAQCSCRRLDVPGICLGADRPAGLVVE